MLTTHKAETAHTQNKWETM